MASSHDNGAHKGFFFLAFVGSNSFDTHYFIAPDDKACHARLEMYLASATDYGVAHILNDAGQTVGAYMGVSIN
jgi:hypothetical protein